MLFEILIESEVLADSLNDVDVLIAFDVLSLNDADVLDDLIYSLISFVT